MTPKRPAVCKSGFLFYQVWSSISNGLSLNPSAHHQLQWPLSTSQPRKCSPDGTPKQPGGPLLSHSTPQPPANLAFSFIRSLFPNPALPYGQWILLNNKAENFLCPGNVPLAAHAILISRPQCSEGRSQCAQDTWDISAKCFLHFFPLPWIQSMTFTGRIQSGHLSDSLVGKWKWHWPSLLFPEQEGRNAIFSLDHTAERGGMEIGEVKKVLMIA